MDCRLLIDELNECAEGRPWNGSWNMAIDEMLLQGAARGRTTLRFYGWSEPTVSLGYFQRGEDRAAHAPSRSCRWVRRGTGGGAIVHDRELTYSYTLPAARHVRGAAEELYEAFHESLIEALANWRVAARRCALTEDSSSHQWLCFKRRTAADVLIGGAKVCGSAQRRHEGGVLQHGSVLLATSPAAPELPGIAELTGRKVGPRELAEAWLERLGGRLAAQFSRETVDDVEMNVASWLQSSRFENPAWNEKR